MHILYYIGIVIIAGIVTARVMRKFKLPDVTGYLLAGIVIGPSLLGLLSLETVSSLVVVSEAALAFIAYSIGGELNFKHLRKTGSSILLITLTQGIGAMILVVLAMMFIFHQSVAFSLVVGAIAVATAPAATIMVVRQYQAKGPLVDVLLPVVAIDDALAIIAFGFSTTIAKSLTGNGQISWVLSLLRPIEEIILCLVIGFVVGLGLAYFSRRAKREGNLLSLTVASIFLAYGLADALGVSTLLVCMMVGATVSNLAHNAHRVLSVVDKCTPPIFTAFFTLAGADLKISVLRQVGAVGIGYVVFRVIGKVVGAYIGARLTNAPTTVQKYLGLTLIPQAGVALGLSMAVKPILPDQAASIRTLVVGATVIYELFGPLLAKTALKKAGEIGDNS